MEVKFKTFHGVFKTRRRLFEMAAELASEIGPERVINISHSESQGGGVVTVWYWSD